MKIGFDAALGVHPSALMLRAQRTEVLANNIANADTPHFKARDIDFKAALAEQTQSLRGADTHGPERLRTTHDAHLGGPGRPGAAPDLLYRTPELPSLDGNTVDGHVEQAEFANNHLQFMASLRFVNSRFQGMLSAIKGE